MPLQTGATLQAGKYRISRLLYGCSSGAIYLGVQTNSGEPVVIREIALADKSRAERERLVKKARLLTTLQHPNLLDTRQVFARKGVLYLVGGDKGLEPLSDLLQQQGLLSPEQAIQIVSAIYDALVYLHSRALVHGDIRSENIFLGTDGQIKVGPPISPISEVATPAPEPAPLYKGTSEYAPRQGSKLFYLAPEALAGGPPTPATDIYAAGALLYEMLTGRSASAVLAPPYAPNPDIPRWLSRVVLRALSAAPEQRYTASLLKRALQPRFTDKLVSLWPKPRGRPGRASKQPGFLLRRGFLLLVIGFLATVGLSGALARSITEARATILRAWQPTAVAESPAGIATDTATPFATTATAILPSPAGPTRAAEKAGVTASPSLASPTITPPPTATKSPTPSPRATSTPTPSPTATETLVPSLTPTLTDTPSPTMAATSTSPSTAANRPRPTNTPRPSATPTPNRHPAPILLSPPNGAWGQTIFLQWSWPYELEENEWFDIQVWQEGNQPRGIAWTKEPRHTIGEGFSTGLHYWRIVVIQARDGRWEKELTPPSESWTFHRAGAPPPSTPTVIP